MNNIATITITFVFLIAVCEVAAQTDLEQSRPAPIKIAEFGRIPTKRVREYLKTFWREQLRTRFRGHIVTYGSNRDVTEREKLIIRLGFEISNHFGAEGTFFVRGGGQRLKTVLWLLPPGVDPPAP